MDDATNTKPTWNRPELLCGETYGAMSLVCGDLSAAGRPLTNSNIRSLCEEYAARLEQIAPVKAAVYVRAYRTVIAALA